MQLHAKGRIPGILITAATVGFVGCSDSNLAMGDINDLYVVAAPETWARVADTLEVALQPTIRTVADELIYDVVHIDPTDTDAWSDQRRLRQLLLIGTPEDHWIQDALEKGGNRSVAPPDFLTAYDVWARNQLANVLVLENGDQVDPVINRLDEIREMYDDVYREWTMSRMWASGANTDLAASLARDHGFSLMIPAVYKWDARDSTFIFRNDNPSPAELIRQLHITWRSPMSESNLSADEVLGWRQSVGEQVLEFPQTVDLSLFTEGPTRQRGVPAYELQAVWNNPPEAGWPAAGPFITRIIPCREQGRTYLVDAWLYAPGRDKYEYMIQLQTILESFRCDGRPAESPFAEDAA